MQISELTEWLQGCLRATFAEKEQARIDKDEEAYNQLVGQAEMITLTLAKIKEVGNEHIRV